VVDQIYLLSYFVMSVKYQKILESYGKYLFFLGVLNSILIQDVFS